MKNNQVLELIKDAFQESGDHDMDSPFISEDHYDGSMKYIRLAIEKGIRDLISNSLEPACKLSDVNIEHPPHKEDVLLCVVDMDCQYSEKYVVGGYFDADINEYCPYVDNPHEVDVVLWLPLPRAARNWLK